MEQTKDVIVLTGTRPQRLRKRAFVLGIQVAAIAEATGYSPVRVSKVLAGLEASEPMLDKIEEYLAGQTPEEATL